jgi:hypothetical protein
LFLSLHFLCLSKENEAKEKTPCCFDSICTLIMTGNRWTHFVQTAPIS